MANNNRDRNQSRDWEQENTQRDRRGSDQGEGWRANDYDHSQLGSLGVAGYDSEFRSGRGSFYDRDTGSQNRSEPDYNRSWLGNLLNSTPFDERGEHYGRGPVGYRRSDDLIHEDANHHLTEHSYIDATNITVSVHDGEVTLEGTVPDRDQKRYAEDLVEKIHGVNNVINHLRVQKSNPTLTENASGKQQL